MACRYEATEKFWAGFYALSDSQKESVRLNNAPVISSPDRVIAYHLDEQLRSRRISIRMLRVGNIC